MNLPPRTPRSLLAGLILAAACAAMPASAALYNVTFTGTITNSRDAAPFAGVGVVFGGASEGGQNGLTVAGSMLVDVDAYPDTVPDPTIGAYAPLGLPFPQPSNMITSQYSIGGQTFFASQHMGPPNGHSIEFASMQDRFVSNGQQDIFWLQDGSQALLCSDPQNPSTCTGGALSSHTLTLRFFGLADVLSGDTLAQNLTLDLAALTAIISGAGGGQTNSYLMTGIGFDAGGEFNLTSFTMAAFTETIAVPEPAGLLALAVGGLTTLGLRRRGGLPRAR